jgi:hypothetical protein
MQANQTFQENHLGSFRRIFLMFLRSLISVAWHVRVGLIDLELGA